MPPILLLLSDQQSINIIGENAKDLPEQRQSRPYEEKQNFSLPHQQEAPYNCQHREYSFKNYTLPQQNKRPYQGVAITHHDQFRSIAMLLLCSTVQNLYTTEGKKTRGGVLA
jgi:hypothetical protein